MKSLRIVLMVVLGLLLLGDLAAGFVILSIPHGGGVFPTELIFTAVGLVIALVLVYRFVKPKTA